MDYKNIAKQFVEIYYKAYNGHLQQADVQRPQLAGFYFPNSLLTNQDQEFMGVEPIMKYLLNDNMKFHAKYPTNFSSQPSVGNTIFICIQGDSVFVDMENPQKLPFTEIFLISMNQNGNGFIILNQIFSTQGI